MKKWTAEMVNYEVELLSNGMWWLEKNTFINWTTKCTFRDSEYGDWAASPHSVVYHKSKHPNRAKNDRKYISFLSQKEALEKLIDRFGPCVKLLLYTNSSSPITIKLDGGQPLKFSNLYTCLKHSNKKQRAPFDTILRQIKEKFPELDIQENSYTGVTGECVFIHPDGDFVDSPYAVLKRKKAHPTHKRDTIYFISKRQEEVGKKYGRLLIIELAGVDDAQKALVKCQCDCGSVVTIRLGNLKNKTSSCGCYKVDVLKETYTKDLSDMAANNSWGICRKRFETDLTVDDVKSMIFATHCHYCKRTIDVVGRLFRRSIDDGRSIKKLGIDRIDNSKGYLKDNTVPCCFDCNNLKSDYTLDELYNIISNMTATIKGML